MSLDKPLERPHRGHQIFSFSHREKGRDEGGFSQDLFFYLNTRPLLRLRKGGQKQHQQSRNRHQVGVLLKPVQRLGSPAV
jgi:hypothetical protein